MSLPEFKSASDTPQPQIAAANLRVKHPRPGPSETCIEYTDPKKKIVCGKPAVAYVSIPGTDALPKGVRVALCEDHRELHNARYHAKRTGR